MTVDPAETMLYVGLGSGHVCRVPLHDDVSDAMRVKVGQIMIWVSVWTRASTTNWLPSMLTATTPAAFQLTSKLRRAFASS